MTYLKMSWIACLSFFYILLTGCDSNSGSSTSSKSSSSSTSSSASTSSTSTSSSTSSTSTSSGASFPPEPGYPEVRFRSTSFVTVQEGSLDNFYKAEIAGLPNTIDKVSFGLSGTDGEFFTIDSGTGSIRFGTAPYTAAPQDKDGDNIFDIQLIVFSDDQEFDAATLPIQVKVVPPAKIEIKEFQPIFPPDQSNIGIGTESDISILVRTELDLGDYANIISITANDIPLTRSSLEQGLWSGNISIGFGQHTIIYRVIDAAGQIFEHTISVSNNAVPTWTNRYFSPDGTHVYLLDSRLKSVFRADTNGVAIEMISGPKKGDGADLADAINMAVDEESGRIYVTVQEQDTLTSAELLEIDIITGNRKKILSYPPQANALDIPPLVVDASSQEFFVLVWNPNFSRQLLRIDGDIVETIFDDATLPIEQKLCSHGPLMFDRAESVVYLTHHSCLDGSTRISAISLVDGSIQIAASMENAYTTDNVIGSYFDDKNRQIYVKSENSLYRVDLNEQSAQFLEVENDAIATLGGELTWLALPEFKLALPKYYGIDVDKVTDLDFSGGILAMVTSGQVLMWDPTDVSTQSGWTYKAPSVTQTLPGFYNRTDYHGIELDSDQQRYYVYEYYTERSDFISDLTVHLITKDFNGEEIDRMFKASYREANGFRSPKAVSTCRVNLSEEESFFSKYLSPALCANEMQGDASVADGVGIFARNGEVGEIYLDTNNVKTISKPSEGSPYANYFAITHDPRNYLAYALSNHPSQGNLLFAISLLTGHKVIMPGGAPRAR